MDSPPPLVESVPLVLTPKLLHIPRALDQSACLRWPSVSAQLRFTVNLAGDGVATSLTIPRQPLTFSPPRWIPSQSLRLLTDFLHHRSGLRRRYWFRCPAARCRRRVKALFLFPDPPSCLPARRRARFLCRHCLSLPRPSDQIHWYTYQAARDPFRPGISLSVQLRAIPIWYRWQTEGKGREKWERVTG